MLIKTVAAELLRNRFMLVLTAILVILVTATIAVPALVDVDPNRQSLLERFQAPSWSLDPHVLGTDELGRPLWIRLLYGLRTSFMVAALAVMLSFTVGVTIGLVAGYAGGWLDSLVMRIAEIQMALPATLLALSLLAAVGGGIVPLIVILGLDNWMLFMRVTRTLVRGMREGDFVLATRSLGATVPRTVFRHIFPNASPGLVAIAAVELSRVMLAESALSFLGFGVQPPGVSLGLILAEGRDYIGAEWWATTFAGALIVIAVLSVSLLGNWLQAVVDPRQVRTG